MDDADKPASNGRLPDGRFGLGNPGGRGNPNARKMYELRRALVDAATPKVVAGLGRKLAMLGLQGDVQAAKLYLEYVVGKPPQAVELTGADGEPLGLDWGRVQAAVLGALGAFPEARLAVAMSLRRLADDGGSEPGDGPGPGDADGGGGP